VRSWWPRGLKASGRGCLEGENTPKYNRSFDRAHPQLEPAREPRESHVTPSEEAWKGTAPFGAEGALTAALLVAGVLRVGVSFAGGQWC
jgi:hypothetical protein